VRYVLQDEWVGANGTAWRPDIWTTVVQGTGTIDVQSGAGRMLTDATQFHATGAVSTARAQDVEIVALWTPQNPLAAQSLDIWVRASGDYVSGHPQPSSGIAFELNTSTGAGDLEIIRTTSSTTQTTVTSVSKTYTAGTAVWVRARAEGSRFAFKAWDNGTTEPNAWNLDILDHNITGTGFIQVNNTTDAVATRTATISKLQVLNLRDTLVIRTLGDTEDYGNRQMARLLVGRNQTTGGTVASDSTIQGSALNVPKSLMAQLLARLRSTRTPLLPQQHVFTGGTVASDATITGTGLLAQKPLTVRQLDLLRHRTMQALLPRHTTSTGGTVASDSTVTATGSVIPTVNLVQRLRNLQPPRDALRPRLTLNTGAAIASDATITGTGQANAKDVVVRFMARLRTADQATPLQGNWSTGGTINSDSTLTGTGANETGSTPTTQQPGGTWDRSPHRVGDRLPGSEDFDFDFELETLVLMLAVTV
jgi:hypothetical protein